MYSGFNANFVVLRFVEVPPRWTEAKAASDIALTINPEHARHLARDAPVHFIITVLSNCHVFFCVLRG